MKRYLMITNKRHKISYVATTAIILSLLGCIKPIYFYGKAMLAQHLLEQTWIDVKHQYIKENNTLKTNAMHTKQLTILPPWSWADTYPVAKLTLRLNNSRNHNLTTENHKVNLNKQSLTNNSPTMHLLNTTLLTSDEKMEALPEISWIILAGMTGRTMAFGPGWLQNSAKPNQFGNTVISAHNDSHFAILENVNIGDTFILEDQSAKQEHYQIITMRIVDENDNTAYNYSDQKMLTLITCYPFTFSDSNKTKRLVITAIAT